jgi:hypothetical protein
MFRKLFVCFALLGLAVASAKSYNVRLYQPSIVGGTSLKAGDYKVEVKDDKLVIRRGKEIAEAPVKVETGDRKHASTTVRYQNGDGKYRLQEIRLGGTNMKLVVAN